MRLASTVTYFPFSNSHACLCCRPVPPQCNYLQWQHACAFTGACGCHEWSSCIGHLKFSGLEREAPLLNVHRSTVRVNRCVGVATESPERLMKNNAHAERQRKGRREGRLPTIFCHQHLPRDFSSPSLYQHHSQSAAREKINFLLPDYIIRFRLECQLNIPHQHFIKQHGIEDRVVKWGYGLSGAGQQRGSESGAIINSDVPPHFEK